MKLSSALKYVFPALAIPLISSPAWGFTITMTPPTALNLDGIDIATGTFQVNSATGFFMEEGNVVSEAILDNPVSFAATIGSEVTHNLFDADNKFLAIQYEGFFNPDEVGATTRNYHLTVGALNGNDNPEWTVFLPAISGESAFQVSNLGDSTFFTDDVPMLFASELDALAVKTNSEELTNINNSEVESIFVGFNEMSSVQFKLHGIGATAVPEPTTLLGTVIAVGIGAVVNHKAKKR